MHWSAQVCASGCLPAVSLLLKRCLDTSPKVIPSPPFACFFVTPLIAPPCIPCSLCHHAFSLKKYNFHLIYHLRPSCSCSVLVVTPIRGYLAGSSLPSPIRYVPCFIFLCAKGSALSALVDSPRTIDRHRREVSSPICSLYQYRYA